MITIACKICYCILNCNIISFSDTVDLIIKNINLIIRCEVTRVLLLLILQPSPQRLTPSLAQVLEKYAWAEENVNNGINLFFVFLFFQLFFVLTNIFEVIRTNPFSL